MSKRVKDLILSLLERRILILDGAMGTMIQSAGLDETAFRGKAFAHHSCELKGCNDLLVLTQPEFIMDIHRAYLKAGADIIEDQVESYARRKGMQKKEVGRWLSMHLAYTP